MLGQGFFTSCGFFIPTQTSSSFHISAQPERRSYAFSYHCLFFFFWIKKPLTSVMFYNDPLRWLSGRRSDPRPPSLRGSRGAFTGASRPSPTSHLPFPGHTADRSSNMTWMWPDGLCVSPTGSDLSLDRPGLCTLCHSLQTQYLSDVIQQGFKTGRHVV